MSIVVNSLPPPVKSLDEMLAIAGVMEQEAAERYTQLADCMRKVGHAEIAELLAALAAEERDHVGHVESLARRMLHRAPDANGVRRDLPTTFGRGDSVGAAALLSPYRALSIAVRSEERAFAFWTYVAASSTDSALRELAETFADQELKHAANLRSMRRKARRTEERRFQPAPRSEADQQSEAQIRMEAAIVEGFFASYCTRAAKALGNSSDIITVTLFSNLADEARQANAALQPGQTEQRRGELAERHFSAVALLFEAAGMAENLNDLYLDWLDAADGDAWIQCLQERVQASTARLARINVRLLSLEPSLAVVTGE
jgi:rubrerythrin